MRLSIENTRQVLRICLYSLIVSVLVLSFVHIKAGLFVVGITLVFIGLVVEFNHKVIWEDYVGRYGASRNKLLNFLNKPSRLAHSVDIFVLMPIVIVLGMVLVYVAFSGSTASYQQIDWN